MRIPPFYRYRSWQRFLSGMAIGGVISWFIFIYMFGYMQEKQSTLINEQISEINKLTKQKDYWQGEFKKANEEIEKKLTVQEIEINLRPNEKIKLSKLQEGQIVDLLEDYLGVIKAKNLESVFDNKELIRKSIETKVFEVDGKKYKLRVYELFIYTTFYIEVTLDLA